MYIFVLIGYRTKVEKHSIDIFFPALNLTPGLYIISTIIAEPVVPCLLVEEWREPVQIGYFKNKKKLKK